MKMLRQFEKWMIGLLLGAAPIICCFLASWWLSIPFVSESHIFIFALAGLAVGVMVDVFFLKTWVRCAYSMSPMIWMGIYLFYSIGIFGFFMGVPVFNLLLAIPAGFFVGAKLAHKRSSEAEIMKAVLQAALFTTIVLGVVCAASAAIALLDPSTAANLEGLFRLHFAVTFPMLLGVILVGGVVLLAVNWWLMRKTSALVYQALKN